MWRSGANNWYGLTGHPQNQGLDNIKVHCNAHKSEDCYQTEEGIDELQNKDFRLSSYIYKHFEYVISQVHLK